MCRSERELDGRAMLKGHFLDAMHPDHSARGISSPSEVLGRCGKDVTLPFAPRENMVSKEHTGNGSGSEFRVLLLDGAWKEVNFGSKWHT